MKFINVFLNRTGLWSASLCDGDPVCKGSYEEANIGGAYPKARSAELDAQSKWGRKLIVKTSYGRLFLRKDEDDPTEEEEESLKYINP